MTEFRIAEVAYMASDDIMTAGAGGATATVRADIKAAFFDIDGTLTSFVTHVIPQVLQSTRCTSCRIAG
jgi:hypothetical protein